MAKLLNPLRRFSFMRKSLLEGLLEMQYTILTVKIRHQILELGKIYHKFESSEAYLDQREKNYEEENN